MDDEFDFRFIDKSDLDEKDFFLVFLRHLSKPEEIPESPVVKAMRAFSPDFDESSLREIEQKQSKMPIFYSAYYDDSTGQLDMEVIKNEEHTPHPIGEDPWKVFHRHATFKEILGSIEPDDGTKLLAKMENFSKNKGDKDKCALQIIRDQPAVLFNKYYAYELVEIMHTARWSTSKKEATKALNLLKEHLLPKRPGGRIPLPANIEAIKCVLNGLAEYLSKKCKDEIDCYTEKKGEELDEYDYESLVDWAKEQREFRISRLPRHELSTLVYKPISYVHDLLESHFGTSMKTIRRSKSK